MGNLNCRKHPVMCKGTRVIVTFLFSSTIDLREHGINEAQATNLRTRFPTFAEDWESPEMSVYDNYDEEKVKLQTR